MREIALNSLLRNAGITFHITVEPLKCAAVEVTTLVSLGKLSSAPEDTKISVLVSEMANQLFPTACHVG